MKCEIDAEGVLLVYPETSTERYAMRTWENEARFRVALPAVLSTHAHRAEKVAFFDYPKKEKSRHGFQKLGREQAADIKRRRTEGERGVDLANEYGVSQQIVCNIFKGREGSFFDYPKKETA